MPDNTDQTNEPTDQSEPHGESWSFQFGKEVLNTKELMRFERVKDKTIWGYINSVKSETLDITLPEDFELPDPDLPDREFLRAHIVATVKQFNGFGVGNIPKPSDPTITNSKEPPQDGYRGKAYGNLCFPFKGDDVKKTGNLPSNNESYSTGRGGNFSSCAVAVRSLWQLLGARHSEYINPPYIGNQVMTHLIRYALYCGAYYSDVWAPKVEREGKECKPHPLKRDFYPQKGDVLFIGKYNSEEQKYKDEHALTVTNTPEPESQGESFIITSCDGGQNGYQINDQTVDDDGCNGIRLRRRTFTRKTMDLGGRTVFGWVKITELLFTGELILLHRNEGVYYLPEPSAN